MPQILLPAEFQPPLRARVDRAHPLASSLLSAALPWGYDAGDARAFESTSDFAAPGGRNTQTYSSLGISRTFGSATTGTGHVMRPGSLGALSGSRVNHTRFFGVMVTGTGGLVNSSVSTSRPSGNGGLAVRVLNTRNVSLVNQGISGFLSSTVTLDIGTPYLVACRLFDNGTNTTSEIWIDGVLRGTTTSSTSFAADSAQSSRIGGTGTSLNGALDYLHIPFHYAWDTALPDAALQSLFQRPWQLFEPRRIWVPVGAGGGVELDLVASAIAVSGGLSASGDIQIGTGLDLSALPVAVAGGLSVAGDLEITEAPELDLDAGPVALAGGLSVAGDLNIGTSFDLAAGEVAVTGGLSVTGDLESSVDPALDFAADPVAVSGALSVSGDLDIGTSFDLAAGAVPVAGGLAVSGDLEYGVGADLAADPLALSGSVAVSGDLAFSTDPIAPPAYEGTGNGGGMPMSFERWRRSLDEIDDGELRRLKEEDEMVLDCITALVAAGVL